MDDYDGWHRGEMDGMHTAVLSSRPFRSSYTDLLTNKVVSIRFNTYIFRLMVWLKHMTTILYVEDMPPKSRDETSEWFRLASTVGYPRAASFRLNHISKRFTNNFENVSLWVTNCCLIVENRLPNELSEDWYLFSIWRTTYYDWITDRGFELSVRNYVVWIFCHSLKSLFFKLREPPSFWNQYITVVIIITFFFLIFSLPRFISSTAKTVNKQHS